MAVANPVITALLTIVVFLEKDKLRKRSEDIETALKNSSASIVQTIEAQKQDFTNIADRLEALSKDSEKSAETFIGLSTALTESSAVSAKALGGVTEGLQAHATSVAALVTDLSTKVSATSTAAIGELGNKTADAIKTAADQLTRIEAAQIASKDASTQAISDLALRSTELSNNLSDISATAISDLSIKTAEAIKLVAEQVAKVEAAQLASKEASTQAIRELIAKNIETLNTVSNEVKKVEVAQIASKEASAQAISELAARTSESLQQVADEIKRIEAAQAASAKSSAESLEKLTQEIGQTGKSIKELQETLKSTVTL
ncbi:hypothetical protein NZK27_11935 [Synechococcus sp. FGCU-3]|nr:hypothetical protein [Synechococcus sp. FGCU3]